jgi:hypothetical protein
LDHISQHNAPTSSHYPEQGSGWSLQRQTLERSRKGLIAIGEKHERCTGSS